MSSNDHPLTTFPSSSLPSSFSCVGGSRRSMRVCKKIRQFISHLSSIFVAAEYEALKEQQGNFTQKLLLQLSTSIL